MTTNVALLPEKWREPPKHRNALEMQRHSAKLECADELESTLAHRQDGELLALCREIVRDAIPATASGLTCFVPRYQLDKLRALSQPSEPSKSQVKRIALERGESPGLADSGEVGNG